MEEEVQGHTWNDLSLDKDSNTKLTQIHVLQNGCVSSINSPYEPACWTSSDQKCKNMLPRAVHDSAYICFTRTCVKSKIFTSVSEFGPGEVVKMVVHADKYPYICSKKIVFCLQKLDMEANTRGITPCVNKLPFQHLKICRRRNM